MTQTRMTTDEFAVEVMWLVDGNCTGFEIEQAFGRSMATIRRRIARRARNLIPITPAHPWRMRLLELDRQLNVLDVEIRNPIAA